MVPHETGANITIVSRKAAKHLIKNEIVIMSGWGRFYARISLLVFIVFLSACGSEADQISSSEGTPLEVVQSATGKMPADVRIVETNSYMSIDFLTNSMNVRGHLLDVKRTMRVVLEEYPEVSNFFFGWKHDSNSSQYYMKMNFSRSVAERADWVNVMVDEIKNYADELWLIPALR